MEIEYDNTATTTVLYVPGMTCGHCESAVMTELAKVPGVASVTVDLVTKDVTFEGVDVDPALVAEAIDEAGFEIRTR